MNEILTVCILVARLVPNCCFMYQNSFKTSWCELHVVKYCLSRRRHVLQVECWLDFHGQQWQTTSRVLFPEQIPKGAEQIPLHRATGIKAGASYTTHQSLKMPWNFLFFLNPPPSFSLFWVFPVNNHKQDKCSALWAVLSNQKMSHPIQQILSSALTCASAGELLLLLRSYFCGSSRSCRQSMQPVDCYGSI